jgi:putative FmdB family regulatory protein
LAKKPDASVAGGAALLRRRPSGNPTPPMVVPGRAPMRRRSCQRLTGHAHVTIRLSAMPTYEYVCSKCGHEFEKFQPIADKPLTVCPKDRCPRKKWGRGKVKKQIGAGAGLLFKGSGFYITDYRSEKYKEAAKKDSASAGGSGGDGKPASSSESKPAPKKETKPSKTGARS